MCGVSGLSPSVTPVQSGPHAHPCQQAQDEQSAHTSTIYQPHCIIANIHIHVHVGLSQGLSTNSRGDRVPEC